MILGELGPACNMISVQLNSWKVKIHYDFSESVRVSARAIGSIRQPKICGLDFCPRRPSYTKSLWRLTFLSRMGASNSHEHGRSPVHCARPRKRGDYFSSHREDGLASSACLRSTQMAFGQPVFCIPGPTRVAS